LKLQTIDRKAREGISAGAFNAREKATTVATPVKGRSLWNILIPCADNSGRKFPLFVRRMWNEQVRRMTDGMSIMQAITGEWRNPENGRIVREKMIPVSLLMTQREIAELAQFTRTLFKQNCVMYYRVSSEVFMAGEEKATVEASEIISPPHELNATDDDAYVL
jgi:hypothetical protein